MAKEGFWEGQRGESNGRVKGEANEGHRWDKWRQRGATAAPDWQWEAMEAKQEAKEKGKGETKERPEGAQREKAKEK